MVSVSEQAEAVLAIQTLLQKGEEQSMSLKELLPASLPGVLSLTHRLRAEINALQKGLCRRGWLKLEHVHSSNLNQLGAVVDLATALRDKVDGVLRKFRDEASVPVYVDIVANGGLLWIKVVCRCPNALQMAHLTGGRAGERPPLEQAAVLQKLAAQHTVLYTAPKVMLVFCKGVSYSLCQALQKRGVLVLTRWLIPDAKLNASRYTDDGASSVGDDGSLDGDDETDDGTCSEDEDGVLETADSDESSVDSEQSLPQTTQSINDPQASSDGNAYNFPEVYQSSSDEKFEKRSNNALKFSCLPEAEIRIIDESLATMTSTRDILVDINDHLQINDLNAPCADIHEESSELDLKKRWPMSSNEEMTCIAKRIATLMSECELATRSQKSRALNTKSEKSISKCLDSISSENVDTNDINEHSEIKKKSQERNKGDVVQDLVASDAVSETPLFPLVPKEDCNSLPPSAPTDPSRPSSAAPLPGALPLVTTLTSPSFLGHGHLVCLDVSCMIAYVSNTTNGHAQYCFSDKFLLEQATWERSEPVNPVIESYWQGQLVLVCEEAVRRFEGIVAVMAGQEERRRADQLLSAVTVVPDCDALQDALSVCGGITASARVIFGTAVHYRAPIITANKRFVRAAQTQGVRIAALLHSPRALTEQKQTPR